MAPLKLEGTFGESMQIIWDDFSGCLGSLCGSVGALITAGNFRTSLTLRGADRFLRFDGLRLESESKHTNERMQRVLQRERE